MNYVLAQGPDSPVEIPNHLEGIDGWITEVEVLQDDSCSAQIFDIAIARMEGNLVQVEVILDTEWGLDLAAQPHPYNRLYVSVPGRTNPLPVSVNSDGRYVFIVSIDESESFTFSAYDPCINMYDTIGTQSAGCGSYVPFDSIFQQEFIAYTDSSGGVSIHDWLNGLDYLSNTQRWAFYQNVYADCAEIPFDNLLPTMLSGSYTEPTQECSCSVVRFTRNIVPGSAPRFGNGAIGIERTQDYGVQNNNAYYYESYGGGASKSVWSYADASGNGNNPFTLRKGTGQTNALTRRAELSVGIVCFDGLGQIDRCGCSRDLKVFYEYRADLMTNTELLFSFSGEKESQAMATDYGGFAATVGNDGDTEVINFSINTIASACKKEPNEVFYSALGSLIGGITAFNWVTPQATGGTQIDSARIVQQQNQLSSNLGANLGTLLSTSPTIATPCQRVTETNEVIGTKTFQLTPNEFVKLEIRSGELTQVGGNRSYYSRALITSGFAIATFINSKDSFPEPDWCCTQTGGSWLAGSFITDYSDAKLLENITSWHGTLPYNHGAASSGVGSYVADTEGPFGCANVEIENLVFKELEKVSRYYVHDISGRVISEVASRPGLLKLSLRDGFYIISSLSRDGALLKTEKVMSINGRLQLVSQ